MIIIGHFEFFSIFCLHKSTANAKIEKCKIKPETKILLKIFGFKFFLFINSSQTQRIWLINNEKHWKIYNFSRFLIMILFIHCPVYFNHRNLKIENFLSSLKEVQKTFCYLWSDEIVLMVILRRVSSNILVIWLASYLLNVINEKAIL